MKASLLERVDPVAGFRGLCAALRSDHGWISDTYWLRFAAQAAALRPDAPEDSARAIHAFLAHLRKRCGWGDSLQTPFGQMIAAAMVQVGDDPAAFMDDVGAARRLMHAMGLPHSNWYELKAIAALRLLHDGEAVAWEPVLKRLAQIYGGMRKYHWWNTGRHELPTCALLTACAGEPVAIIGNAEAVASALAAGGMGHGHALQTAAGILPLAGMFAGAVFERFEALQTAIAATGIPHDGDTVAIVAMLCLLDHEPAVIAGRLAELYGQVTDPGHPAFVVADLAVAADLCYLELLRCDRQGQRVAKVNDDPRIRRLMRLQRAIAVVIADVPVEPVASDWPLMPYA